VALPTRTIPAADEAKVKQAMDEVGLTPRL
jgi:hypothetical protein